MKQTVIEVSVWVNYTIAKCGQVYQVADNFTELRVRNIDNEVYLRVIQYFVNFIKSVAQTLVHSMTLEPSRFPLVWSYNIFLVDHPFNFPLLPVVQIQLTFYTSRWITRWRIGIKNTVAIVCGDNVEKELSQAFSKSIKPKKVKLHPWKKDFYN